ncbi:MAG: methyltransferase domain-containing protein, partial [Gaiellaceae bacterium]
MASLEQIGVRCLGLDHATAALQRCRERGVDARRFDTEQDPLPAERVDLVVSTEVAEHLPESSADRFRRAFDDTRPDRSRTTIGSRSSP